MKAKDRPGRPFKNGSGDAKRPLSHPEKTATGTLMKNRKAKLNKP